jgi:hypothetical protein
MKKNDLKSITKKKANDVPRQAKPEPISAPHELGKIGRNTSALNNKLSKNAVKLFVFISCGLFLAFFVGLLKDPLGTQRYIFFEGLDDLFSDFFNALRYIAERDPYFNQTNGYAEKGYLPLSYMLVYPFSQLDNFATMSSISEAWSSKMGLISCFIFIGLSIFLLSAALNQIVKKYSVPSIILISLALSYVFIFSVERANIIFISAACVTFFICNYDSEDKYKRIWAAISLALAATLKVYPILLGFLYLAKKQYREMFFCALITLPLVFVPYLFFKGGFVNIPQHISNLITQSQVYGFTRIYEKFGLPFLLYCCCTILKFPEAMILSLLSVAKIINIILPIIAIVFSCLEKNKWLQISLLTMVILFLPTHSSFYCGLYVFPMIILFFATMRERSKTFNIFTFIIFIVLLNPFMITMPQFALDKHMNYLSGDKHMNYLIANIALLSLYFVLIISSGKQIVINYIIRVHQKRTHITPEGQGA